jgi:RecA/RadA recombinase
MSEFKFDRDFFTDLMKDTEFVLAETGSVMHSRKKVPTPLYVINCIYGGGIPLGVVSEISGPPGSGKSTFSYQCMANFQKKYPQGVAVIYDMETSMDNTRLRALGVDIERVLRLPASSYEDAFANMFKMLNKLLELQKTYPDISSFQIYDSISSGGTERQHDSVSQGKNAFNSGSMMEVPRIIKQNLSNLFPYLEKLPVYVGLLNQVFTQVGVYTSKIASGGGYGLKHLCHFHISFGDSRDDYKDGFLVGTTSMVRLEKSKLSPKIIDIPCYIDVTKGGRIDEVDSFVKYLSKGEISIVKTGSWYNIKDTVDRMISRYPILANNQQVLEFSRKSFRKDDFYAEVEHNEDLKNFLLVALIDFINDIYPAQADVNDEYRKELIGKCSYFNGMEMNDEGEVWNDSSYS